MHLVKILILLSKIFPILLNCFPLIAEKRREKDECRNNIDESEERQNHTDRPQERQEKDAQAALQIGPAHP